MCMMCMVLSPNCGAATIFEYSTTEVMLPSCLSVPSEHVRSEVYSKVEREPKHEVAIIERKFKFRKRRAFSFLGSLRTVPLHST